MWCAPLVLFGFVYDVFGMAFASLAIAAFVLWYRGYLLARIGGVTGDCLGFSAYVGMILTTLALARDG